MHPILRNSLLVLFSGVLAFLIAQTKLMASVDFYLYDFMLTALKTKQLDTEPDAENNNRAQPVVVIGIDDETLNAFPEPMVLWHKYLSIVLRGLSESQADVIGLDMIPSISLDTISPNYDRLLFQAIRKARKNKTEVVLGYDASSGGLLPHQKFIFAASDIAYLNLWPESDGVIRQYSWSRMKNEKVQSSLIKSMFDLSGVKKEQDSASKPFVKEQRFYINFNQSNIPVYSFLEVYQQINQKNYDWLASHFNQSIVLIGLNTEKLNDNHRIPFETEQHSMPGVLIHAAALNSIVSGNSFEVFSESFQYVLFVLMIILSAGLFLFLSPLKASLLLLISAAILFWAYSQLLSNHHVLPMTLPISALVTSSLLCAAYRYGFEYQKYRQLQRHFKRYVNDDVLQQIMNADEDIGFNGRKVHATVMFADIRNYTTMSEQLLPSEIVTGLNRYFTVMTKAICDEGGYMNSYLGDGLLAIFGAPNALEKDGALAAVKSARKMLEALNDLNKSHLFKGIDEIHIGIGIHTGEAVVGNLGCYEKMDYSIIGDTVNLASRIEGQTKLYEKPILISESTYEKVQSEVDAKFVATTKVKGRDQAVNLYEVT